jgi:hypothetical protein
MVSEWVSSTLVVSFVSVLLPDLQDVKPIATTKSANAMIDFIFIDFILFISF